MSTKPQPGAFYFIIMALRFTDSRKFQDPWYRSLPALYKVFWEYLLSTCNHAGIWKVDLPLAEFCIGDNIDMEKALKLFKGRVTQISSEKWFISKYLKFQYKGELNLSVKAHLSAYNLLLKEGIKEETLKGLLTLTKPLINGYQRVKDKDQDKDKDNINNKYRGIHKGEFQKIWNKFPNKVGYKAAERHFNTTVKTEKDLVNIKKALNNYLSSERVRKGFIQNGSTWFNDWASWLSYIHTKKEKVEQEKEILERIRRT